MGEIKGIPAIDQTQFETDQNQELVPENRCIALKEYDCLEDACPLWENGACTVEIAGKVLGNVFTQFTMLISTFQSMSKEQKVDTLKLLLRKAFAK